MLVLSLPNALVSLDEIISSSLMIRWKFRNSLVLLKGSYSWTFFVSDLWKNLKHWLQHKDGWVQLGYRHMYKYSKDETEQFRVQMKSLIW